MRQADDLLGERIGRGRLAGEDLDARAPVLRGVRTDGVVLADGVQDVEQLALVFVDALDLHVEQGVRVERQAELGGGQPCHGEFTRAALGPERLAEPGILGMWHQPGEQVRIPQHAVAQRVHQQLGQAGVGLVQPAAEGDAIGAVDDAAPHGRIQVPERGAAHQVRVQRRHAVDRVAAQEGQVAHPHPAAARLVDEAQGGQQPVIQAARTLRVQMAGVEQIDDLHVARQQAFEQQHRHISSASGNSVWLV